MPGPVDVPVARLVGNTPLVDVARVGSSRVLAKLEGMNPGGSVKDRAALFMVEDGERRGLLTRERALVDATSGNTGIAYAMLCAAKGYRCRLYMPANASEERKRALRAYGAELVLTDPLEGQDGAIDACREEVAKDPDRWFYPDQYSNPQNPLAHYATTGPEVWRETRGEVTHFVAGLGTSGTMMGTGRYLREQKADVALVAVEPDDAFHGLEGLKHMPSSCVPRILDPKAYDRLVRVATEDAYAATRRLAREQGLLVGPSSGAAHVAATRVAAEADGAVVVAVFPDGGGRYLSGRLFE